MFRQVHMYEIKRLPHSHATYLVNVNGLATIGGHDREVAVAEELEYCRDIELYHWRLRDWRLRDWRRLRDWWQLRDWRLRDWRR